MLRTHTRVISVLLPRVWASAPSAPSGTDRGTCNTTERKYNNSDYVRRCKQDFSSANLESKGLLCNFTVPRTMIIPLELRRNLAKSVATFLSPKLTIHRDMGVVLFVLLYWLLLVLPQISGLSVAAKTMSAYTRTKEE